MICQIIGLPPISTMGFGLISVSSLIRVPNPPAKMTTFIACKLAQNYWKIIYEKVSNLSLLLIHLQDYRIKANVPFCTKSPLHSPWAVR